MSLSRTRYAFALKDKNLPIRKRLFLTATPRHYDVRKRDKEGDFAVTSMDDEALYGRVLAPTRSLSVHRASACRLTSAGKPGTTFSAQSRVVFRLLCTSGFVRMR